jgi:hypothetical protein
MAALRESVRSFPKRAWTRCCAVPALRQDAALYAAAATWSAITWGVAVSNDYREWAAWTLGPYLLSAIVCEVAFRRRRAAAREPRLTRVGDPVRTLSVVGLVLFTLLLPLTTQVLFRASTTHVRGAQAQPEVAVIERAGDRMAKFQDPYLQHPTDVGKSPWTDSPNIDSQSYFPYLPGMAFFGLANAVPGVKALGDARVELGGFAFLVVLLALALMVVPVGRRLRAFQVLLVLPTGALPFVTGGDDLPVLALMLLALVLAQRRLPGWSGIAMGMAAAMKFSAWGLLAFLLFAQYDRLGQRARLKYAAAALGVIVPFMTGGVLLGPQAFLVNAVEYPLDLARAKSSAGSPLPGHALLKYLPTASGVVAIVVVGLLVLAGGLWLLRHLPQQPSQAAVYTAVAMGVLTLLAPASRFGYLIYPLNLMVWATMLREPREVPSDEIPRSVAGAELVSESGTAAAAG